MTPTTPDENTFETLRLLRERFGRAKRQTRISTWMIVLQEFDENEFTQHLTK